MSLRDGSLVSSATFGKGDAGKVTIDIKGNLSLDKGSSINSFVNAQAVGNSQGISIGAKHINISSSSGIISNNFGGIGNAGNIDIKTTGDLNLVGYDRSVPTSETILSAISSGTDGRGDAGKITIETGGILSLNNGAIISADISSEGKGNSKGIAIDAKDLSLSNFSSIVTGNLGTGNAGNIDIKTTGDLTIVGSDRSIPLVDGVDAARLNNSSSISSNSRGKGDTGKITIDTKGNISLDNRAFISSEILRAKGNSQGISIVTKNLKVTNNSAINTANQGSIGNAGNIDIKANGDVEIAGLTDLSLFNQQGSNSSSIITTNLDGIGNSGNINIESKGNIGLSKAFISSFSGGKGQAANISISSQKLNLNNMSFIATDGFSVGGGNITLAISDLLLLRNTSSISSKSLSAEEKGNGGNITISSPLIVAAPGNNDISANAFQGSGGNVQITSQGLFGIQFRPKGQDSPFTNDITASSTFGQNGTVNITTPGTDPGRDSTELPNTTTDASNQISQACSTNNRQNKLIVAGRGGIPPNANDPLTSDLVWEDARAVSIQPAVSSTPNNLGKLVPPAVGWVFDGKGKVTLVAAATPGQPTGTSVACPQGVGK
ncbi:S-layer family protein [Chamaesiphon sp. GL140_3_metabinner_50]|uniref:beta strand repeat-containing protein n=1 Tax=Chamaesiphon sp. GL140_3_metabinner_50 TaxID=2970812 RepID=UPI0025EB530D|nr:S-layer family protein [Chamaesiphon sp. GL140_3_metabinner_50]